MNNPPTKSKFNIIIIEGIDGCGKGSVINGLVNRYGDAFHYKHFCFKEPDGVMRGILRSGNNISYFDEYMAMWIWRFDLWTNKILGHIRNGNFTDIKGVNFYIDRSFPSTFAYQIEGRGRLDLQSSFFFWKARLFELFKDIDITIHHVYLRVSVDTAFDRIGKRGSTPDELKQFEEKVFLQRVKTGYDLFYGNSDNFLPIERVTVIDASKSIEEVVRGVLRDIS